MDRDKGKAIWDVESTGMFIHACIEQIYAKQRQGNAFTKIGWDNITATFSQKTGRVYDRKQLKNRLDILRKEWRTWDTLFSKETGIGRDPVSNTVVVSDEWWQRKIQENPLYRKYRYNWLRFERELNIIFKDAVTSGEYIFAPSSTQPQPPPQPHGADDDVYRPSIDLEEGSGDNEDENFGANQGASAGVTDELAGIDLGNNTGSGSQRKRKRGDLANKSKRQEIPSSKQIADAVSQMANASKDRTSVLRGMRDISITEVVSELISMEELAHDDDFRNRCIEIMMDKNRRETFVALKVNRTYLLSWLRAIAYSSSPSSNIPLLKLCYDIN